MNCSTEKSQCTHKSVFCPAEARLDRRSVGTTGRHLAVKPRQLLGGGDDDEEDDSGGLLGGNSDENEDSNESSESGDGLLGGLLGGGDDDEEEASVSPPWSPFELSTRTLTCLCAVCRCW